MGFRPFTERGSIKPRNNDPNRLSHRSLPTRELKNKTLAPAQQVPFHTLWGTGGLYQTDTGAAKTCSQGNQQSHRRGRAEALAAGGGTPEGGAPSADSSPGHGVGMPGRGSSSISDGRGGF